MLVFAWAEDTKSWNGICVFHSRQARCVMTGTKKPLIRRPLRIWRLLKLPGTPGTRGKPGSNSRIA